MNRRDRVLVTVAALAAALPQLIQFAGHVRRDDYPGSAWNPRVAATVRVSRAALEGGPFVTIPAEGGYSVARGRLNDLGVGAIIDILSRSSGHRASRTTLGCINLFFLAAACAALVAGYPAVLRLFLVPVFLLVPMVVPLYLNVDSVGIHGALAALTTAVVLAVLRIPRTGVALSCGVALFVVHKVRSPFAMYALVPLVLGTTLAWRRFRDAGPARRIGWMLLAFALCEVPWQIAMSRRADDPRVVEKDKLSNHAVWEALISGIGWTENPWGIKPSDPWVATFLAERVGGDPVVIETREGERRARIVYARLVGEHPFGLAWLYLKRVPLALAEYSVLGAWGAALWIPLSALALALGWRRGDADGLAALVASLGLAFGLIAQVVVIDTRYIYAYPLELVSALALATATGILCRHAIRPGDHPAGLAPAPGGARQSTESAE
jgi:hypothetical protein